MNKRMILFVTAILLLSASSLFAQGSKTIAVNANIPTISSGLNINVSKINAITNVWMSTSPNNPIDFGTLSLDNVNSIFTSQFYYAVDIGVNDNTGTPWTITHTVNSIKKDAINNLDNNVNVAFMKQTSASDATQLGRTSFASSNNLAFTQATLSNGWLRIYYGLGTGSGDASGVLPIGMNKPAGTYTGSVVITLTP